MDFTKLDEFMAGMEARGIPACDLTVMRDGRVVYRHLQGFSDAAKTKPVSDSDLYRLYSCTKVCTCVAALRAVERGLIGLDDPVASYLPTYADLRVRAKDGSLTPAKNPMTVRHLFTMTAGLNYNLGAPSIREAIAAGEDDTVSVALAIGREPLDFECGTRYQYSLCHDVLAAVVEVAAGMRYSDYVRREIFEPLGMTDTTFHPTAEQQMRESTLWRYRTGSFTAEECRLPNAYVLSERYESGGAGLYSTAASYAKLVAALSNGGTSVTGYELLRPATVQLLKENQLCPEALADFSGDGRFCGYGFGLCCRTHMRPEISLSPSSVGEFGWDSAANAYLMADDTNRVGIFYLTHVLNCGYGYNIIHRKLRELVYSCLASDR